MAEIDVEDCRISYDVSGPDTAPCVLLIPALGTTRELFDSQRDALASGFRIVRADLRGHGRSDAPAEPYTIERLARDMLAVLDSERIERAHLVGVSIGGQIAMWLGLHAAERVERLVLANTSARVGTREQWNERIQLVQQQGISALLDGMLSRWFSERFLRERPDVVDQYARMLSSCAPAGYAGCCAALGASDLRSEVSAIRAATLVITGSDDLAATPAEGEWLCRQIAGARLLELRAAHFAHVEEPDRFNDELSKFLAG